MPKFSITTLGCKVNQAESEALADDLLSSDWAAAGRCDEAEVCIINTCTVTQKASMQSRQAIRQAIRANPDARVIVTGCYAQTAPQEIDGIDGVDYVIGHDKKLSIGRMIRSDGDEAYGNQGSAFGSVRPNHRFESMPAPISAPRTRPFLKIQDGCNAFCTYCIVPYARGRSRSMPLEDVIKSVQALSKAGFHEVVLTGIHLGAYGHDLAPATDLAELMARIDKLQPIARVRISSVEPFELSGEIIRRVAESDIFCQHFHIPLQSGDDHILNKMGRPYSRRDFHQLIDHIHGLMPEAAIGVDALIGFPGESQAAFDNTCSLIADLPISYLHVFPFSSRPGTAADNLPDKIEQAVIKARCGRMRELGHRKRLEFYGRFVAKSLPVLIESKRDATTGKLKGFSSNYLPVLIEGSDDLQNQIVEVKIEKIEGDRLYGALPN